MVQWEQKCAAAEQDREGTGSMPQKEVDHKHHRQRLKERFLQEGLDHIIVSGEDCVSLRDSGFLGR